MKKALLLVGILLILSAVAVTAAPTCTFVQSSGTTYKQTQVWQVNGGSEATSATITFGSNAAQTMTVSGGVASYTGNSLSLPAAVYNTVTATVSNGTSTTTCTPLTYVQIKGDDAASHGAAFLAKEQKKEGFMDDFSLGGLSAATLILIGLGIYLFFDQKKK